MPIKLKFAVAASALIAGLALAPPANAGVIVGGSALLTSGFVTQLEGWLGEGELTLTNIYTKQSGDTSSDFHAAVDGQGRTFSIIEVIEDGITHIIGGYNPQSWRSDDTWTFTSLVADRTGFIFNLSTGTLHPQETFIGGWGNYQTWNDAPGGDTFDGPTFGAGYDIVVAEDLLSGYAYAYSYCSNPATDCDQTFGTANILGSSDPEDYEFDSVGRIEIFSLPPLIVQPPEDVPAPGAIALLCVGLLGLGATRRTAVPTPSKT